MSHMRFGDLWPLWRLLGKLLHVAQVHGPGLRGTAPYLRTRNQTVSLASGSGTNGEYLGIVRRGRIDVCAALGTECLGTPGTAFGSFHVDLRFPGKQPELVLWRQRTGAIGRPRKHLAVGAMA